MEQLPGNVPLAGGSKEVAGVGTEVYQVAVPSEWVRFCGVGNRISNQPGSPKPTARGEV